MSPPKSTQTPHRGMKEQSDSLQNEPKSEDVGGAVGDDHLINLNEAQSRNIWRNALIIISIFGIYLLVGVLVFHNLCDWDILNTVFFICVTFSTIGYGDLDADMTETQRIFTSLYLLIGLIAIASFMSVYLQMMQEHTEAVAAERNKQIAKYLAESRDNDLGSMIMHSMKRASHEIGRTFSRTMSRSSSLSFSGQPGDTPGDQAGSAHGPPSYLSRLSSSLPFSEQSNDVHDIMSAEEIARMSRITEATLEQSSKSYRPSGVTERSGANELLSAYQGRAGEQLAHASGDAIVNNADLITLEDDKDLNMEEMSEDDRNNLRNTLELLRERQSKTHEKHAEQRRMPMEMIIMRTYDEEIRSAKIGAIWSVFAIVAIIVIGTLVMMELEGWDLSWAFYWACQTVTTVGYGDIPPHTRAGKLFCIFFIIFGVGYLASAVANVVKYPLSIRTRHVEAKVLNQFAGDLSEAMLSKIFHSEIYERHPDLRAFEDSMSKSEFILLLLEMMNKVEEKDIVLASRVFEKLDVNGDGDLSTEDMNTLKEKAREAEAEHRKIEERRRAEAEAETLARAALLGRFNSGDADGGNLGDMFTPGRKGSLLDILSNSLGLSRSGKVDVSDSSRSSSQNTFQRSLDERDSAQSPSSAGSGGLISFESDVGTPESSGGKQKKSYRSSETQKSHLPDAIPPRSDNPLHHEGALPSLQQPLNPPDNENDIP